MTFVEIGVGTNLWTRAADVPVYGEWCVGSDNKTIYYRSFCTSKMIHQTNTWNTCLSEEEHFTIISLTDQVVVIKLGFVTMEIWEGGVCYSLPAPPSLLPREHEPFMLHLHALIWFHMICKNLIVLGKFSWSEFYNGLRKAPHLATFNALGNLNMLKDNGLTVNTSYTESKSSMLLHP